MKRTIFDAAYNHFGNKRAAFEALYKCTVLPLDPCVTQPCQPGVDPCEHLSTQLRKRATTQASTRLALNSPS
jgi:hypothetical protein